MCFVIKITGTTNVRYTPTQREDSHVWLHSRPIEPPWKHDITAKIARWNRHIASTSRKINFCFVPRFSTKQQNKQTIVTSGEQKQEDITAMNKAVTQRSMQTKHNVLLLCREATVIYPRVPKVMATALFNVGSQLSLMLKNLVSLLRIREKDESLNNADFENQTPVSY